MYVNEDGNKFIGFLKKDIIDVIVEPTNKTDIEEISKILANKYNKNYGISPLLSEKTKYSIRAYGYAPKISVSLGAEIISELKEKGLIKSGSIYKDVYQQISFEAVERYSNTITNYYNQESNEGLYEELSDYIEENLIGYTVKKYPSEENYYIVSVIPPEDSTLIKQIEVAEKIYEATGKVPYYISPESETSLRINSIDVFNANKGDANSDDKTSSETEIPTYSNSKEFIDLLTSDEDGNSILSPDIKVDAMFNCIKSPNSNYSIDYLVIYGLSSINSIRKEIESLNKQTRFHWENPIEDYNGCVYHLTSENNISNNIISIIVFVDNEQLGFQKTSPKMLSNEVGFDVTPYLFYLGDANGDFRIDATDASKILSVYSISSTTLDSKITDEEKKVMDVNLDACVDASDASQVLSYYSYLSTGGSKTIKQFLKEE